MGKKNESHDSGVARVKLEEARKEWEEQSELVDEVEEFLEIVKTTKEAENKGCHVFTQT